MKSRIRIAHRASFFVLLVSLAALVWIAVHSTTVVPDRIEDEQNGVTVMFEAGDVRTLFADECVVVAWRVVGAQSVTLNGVSVASAGTGEACGGARPRLTVGFDNGRARDFRLQRLVVLDREDVRLLLALALLAVIGILHFGGHLTSLYERIRAFIVRRAPRLVSAWRDIARQYATHWHEASRVHRIVLVIVLALGLSVRLYYISTPIAIDEAKTYDTFVRMPLFQILTDYSEPNNHIVHTVLAHVSVAIFGNQEWSIRLPAFIFGVLALPMTYIAGLRLYNRQAGLLATAFVAASALMIEYSVNARGYSIGTFIFLAQLVLASYLRQQRNWLGWTLFAFLSAVSLATVPTMLYAVAGVQVWLLISILLENHDDRRTRLVRDFILAGLLAIVLTLVFYAGAIVVSGLHQIISNQYVLPQGFRGVISGLPRAIVEVIWQPWHEDFPPLLDWIMLAAFTIGLLFHRRLSRSALPSALVVIIVVLAIVVAQRALPLVRIWQFGLPLYFIAASAGLLFIVQWVLSRHARLAETVATALALIAAVGLTALVVADRTIPRRAPLPEATAIARALEPLLYTDDLVITDPGYRPLRYAFERLGMNRHQVQNRNVYSAPGIYLVLQVGQTIAEQLDTMEVDGAAYSKPLLIQRFNEADVYYLARNPSSN